MSQSDGSVVFRECFISVFEKEYNFRFIEFFDVITSPLMSYLLDDSEYDIMASFTTKFQYLWFDVAR